ncbi:MAG: YerC/YecD family TrpR-related protein [Patescibacteria group bacterium]
MAKIKGRTYYERSKRPEKIGRDEQLALMFDLINAFSLVKTPTETALLLKDLLTAKEIKNLSKRLRIAKLLLNEVTEREIAEELHCSFATISKVNIWLSEGGEGLRNVISKLPAKYKIPVNLPRVPLEFQIPKLILTLATNSKAIDQKELLENFARGVTSKEYSDKTLQEESDLHYQSKKKPS